MEVTSSPRIEELRRRVQKDPTSIAFAQLAEEFRRMGNFQEAISTCRSGLAHHPSYLSARVTLGRALMELRQDNDARTELEMVLDLAPDNLAAIRALAEIHQRRANAGGTFQSYMTSVESTPDEAPLPPVEAAAPVFHPAPAAPPPIVDADPQGQARQPELVDDVPTPAPAPLEAMDALDALTLDLPPTPDFTAWSLDTTFSLPDEPDLSQSVRDEFPDMPAVNPAITELERWLAAIVHDRSSQR